MIGDVLVGIGLQMSNVIVTEKYAQLMATNQTFDYWLKSGWTSIATLVTIITVFLTHVVGNTGEGNVAGIMRMKLRNFVY